MVRGLKREFLIQHFEFIRLVAFKVVLTREFNGEYANCIPSSHIIHITLILLNWTECLNTKTWSRFNFSSMFVGSFHVGCKWNKLTTKYLLFNDESLFIRQLLVIIQVITYHSDNSISQTKGNGLTQSAVEEYRTRLLFVKIVPQSWEL